MKKIIVLFVVLCTALGLMTFSPAANAKNATAAPPFYCITNLILFNQYNYNGAPNMECYNSYDEYVDTVQLAQQQGFIHLGTFFEDGNSGGRRLALISGDGGCRKRGTFGITRMPPTWFNNISSLSILDSTCTVGKYYDDIDYGGAYYEAAYAVQRNQACYANISAARNNKMSSFVLAYRSYASGCA